MIDKGEIMKDHRPAINKVLTRAHLEVRIIDLALEIDQHYEDNGITEIIAICTMKGALHFYSDLIRSIDKTNTLHSFVGSSSYMGRTEAQGSPDLYSISGLLPVKDKHILIVEDIVDTGHTLTALIDALSLRSPASIRSVSLLSKPSKRTVDIEPDFIGFEIPDLFVIGYGLDYDEHYRNLDHITTLEFLATEEQINI